MAYIGQRAAGTTAQSRTLDTMTGDGSTNTLTLSQTPDSVMNVAVYYDGVMQRPGVEYTLSGNTLTFTTAPESGVVVYAMTGGAEDIGSPMAGSVTLDTIVDNAITNNKIVSMSSNKLTGALPALDGSNLTGFSSTIDTKSANDPAIDTNPSAVGHLWANTTSGEMFVCTDNTAGANVWYNVGGGSGDVEPYSFQGTVSGYVSGGTNASGDSNVIDKFSLVSDGNATDVGDLTVARNYVSGQSSETHGYASGGYDSITPTTTNIIEKFSFETDGDASDVGDLTVARHSASGQSTATHGYASGGTHSIRSNVIDKFSFSSDGDASDVGDLTLSRNAAAGQSSETHGYASGGNPITNIIDKFSFSSDGDATDIGDLTVSRRYIGGQSSTTHGYNSGGLEPSYNVIDKFSFSSDGNASDVGNLTVAKGHGTGQSSTTHGYNSGGAPSTNVIEKFSFSVDGDATDVGDLTVARYTAAGQQY